MFGKMMSKILYKELSKYIDSKRKTDRRTREINMHYEEQRKREVLLQQNRKQEFANQILIADTFLRQVVYLEQLIDSKIDKIGDYFHRTWWARNSIEKQHQPYPISYGYIFLTTPQLNELGSKLDILGKYEMPNYMSLAQIDTLEFIINNVELIEQINNRLHSKNYRISEVKLQGPTLTFYINLVSS
ncbi:hypothetical protein [Paenibacillus sp. LHD-38]|uniref:hypothetical protein n=1 Tax=Paenibacillus sp. LHD-38 TaxID=3072143 RepID=UPI00280C5E46|nr:hypothetical protein [Paenibacillus sp. LHD-38]MDQ8734211.1 hypothetical protein [Paenibacillus sp. LHD-38]